MNVDIKKYEVIPGNLVPTISIYKKEAFEVGRPAYTEDRKQDHYERYCSEGDVFKYLLAMDSDQVIGGATLLKRQLSQGITLGGIGGVWTRRDRQGQGVAHKVLDSAVECLKDAGCDVAFLSIDIESTKRVYEKVGFIMLEKEYTFLGRSGKRYFEKNGMLAPILSQDIFGSIISDNQPLDIGRGNL